MPETLKGKVYRIGDAETFTYNNGMSSITKKALYIDASQTDMNTGRVYPNYIKLEFVGDRIATLDGYQVGDEVVATFHARGRFFGRRDGGEGYIVDLIPVQITNARLGAQPQPQPQAQPQPQPQAQPQPQPQAQPQPQQQPQPQAQPQPQQQPQPQPQQQPQYQPQPQQQPGVYYTGARANTAQTADDILPF